MNKVQQLKHFDELTAKMREVMESKGDDYANSDRLNNFKSAGAVIGTTAAIQCLSLIATKVARLGVLLNSGKAPNNESTRDSVLDLANYSILLDMILSECHVGETEKTKDSDDNRIYEKRAYPDGRIERVYEDGSVEPDM